MGIDLIMDIVFFWLVYKFAWKKSRVKHMRRRGLMGNRDSLAFGVFVVAFCISLFGPVIAGFDMFSSFWVFGGIFVSYFITTRIRLGADEIGTTYVDEDEPAVANGRWIGSGARSHARGMRNVR